MLYETSRPAIISVEYERIRCINWFVVWDQKFKNSGVTFAFEKKASKMAECSSTFIAPHSCLFAVHYSL